MNNLTTEELAAKFAETQDMLLSNNNIRAHLNSLSVEEARKELKAATLVGMIFLEVVKRVLDEAFDK